MRRRFHRHCAATQPASPVRVRAASWSTHAARMAAESRHMGRRLAVGSRQGSVAVVGEWRPPVVGLALGEHYVQAADDLSDLDARVEWALRIPTPRRCQGGPPRSSRGQPPRAALRAAVQALAPLVGVVQAACADRGNHEPPDGIADGRSDGRAKKHLTC